MAAGDPGMNLDDLITERLDLLAEADKIKARLDDNAAALLPLLTDAGGRAELSGLPGQGFTVAAPRATFSAAKLAELVGEAKMASFAIFPPSTKAQAAKVVPGALLDECMVSSGKPSIRKMGERRG
jgi:hypothetical protein